MALKLVQPGVLPIGQYDGYDNEVATLLGGEVVTIVSVRVSATDLRASGASSDGYVNTGGFEQRPVVTKNLASTATLLMLADEGISGYGTMVGSLLGSTAGQGTASVIGPHTTAGSGKVTCWANPGLYAVSLDACDTNASTGLQPTNLTLKTGDKLFATSTGVITPNSASSFAGAGSMPIGRFVSFETSNSLVNTPTSLTQALNSPSGSSAPAKTFTYAVFYFNP